MNIIDSIHRQCDELGLLYDPLHSPIKIGPDCYMFMAVRKTEECKTQGKCKQESCFYANWWKLCYNYTVSIIIMNYNETYSKIRHTS